MIFGGLEIVAGGYLLHRHLKHKNEKKQQEVEAETRRHNTFPGAKPAKHHQQHPQQRPPQYQQPVAVTPQQKYACYGSPPPRPQYYQQQSHYASEHTQPRPQPPRHAQTFNIPRRPVPQRKPEIIIQPSLQRTDSFATLSRMPIANGSRPQDVEEYSPVLPPRHNTGLQPTPQHSIYGNAGYSVSTPAFGATPTSPGLTYTMATGPEAHAMQTVDDNWETYGHATNRYSYAPTVSTQLGERDPPPPYAP